MNPVRNFSRFTMFLILAVAAALTPARAQQAAPATPQVEEKVSLNLTTHVQEGDAVGQTFVAAFSKTLAGYTDLNVIQGDPAADAPNVTNFRVITASTGEKSSAVIIVVVRHTKGFEKTVYVGTVLAIVTSDDAADKAAAYVDYLGQVFATIELTGEFDQTGTPPSAQ